MIQGILPQVLHTAPASPLVSCITRTAMFPAGENKAHPLRLPPRLSLTSALLWLALASLFALSRPPYDDEWFSLAAAQAPSVHQLLNGLAADVHPPWIALLDFALSRLSPSPYALSLFHLLPSFLAVLLLSRVAERRLHLRLAPLAAFHPIVFMYAACARWYPFLFFAQALRAYALWGTHNRRRSRLAFFTGAVLGPMTGYADFLLCANDAFFWLARERRSGALTKGVALVSGAGLVNALVFVVSPLYGAHRSLPAAAWSELAHVPLRNFGEWLVTGLFGQAFLPGIAMALALVALPGVVLASWRLVHRRRTHFMGLWLGGVVACWLILTTTGITQPRYSLLLWFLLTATVMRLLRCRGMTKATAIGTLAYLALALDLTVIQRDFLKGDLNRLPLAACPALLGPEVPDFIFAPYVGTAAELTETCHFSAPIVSANWLRHEGFEPGDELEPLAYAIATHRSVLLVTVPARAGSLGPTNAAAESLLSSRCTLTRSTRGVLDPHYAFKHALDPSVTSWRFQSEAWQCRE